MRLDEILAPERRFVRQLKALLDCSQVRNQIATIQDRLCDDDDGFSINLMWTGLWVFVLSVLLLVITETHYKEHQFLGTVIGQWEQGADYIRGAAWKEMGLSERSPRLRPVVGPVGSPRRVTRKYSSLALA